jgi:hypothetical protein
MGYRTKTCKNKTKKHYDQNKKYKKNKKNKKKRNNKTHHGGIFRELLKSSTNELTRFNDFINIISSIGDLTNATLLMGIDYKCENDLNRNIEEELHPDFCWSESSGECKPRHGTTMMMNQWYQLYFPFKINFIELSPDGGSLIAKNIRTEVQMAQLKAYFNTPTLNKFKKIIFDASTVKFLFRIAPSFIAYLYYYFLEENGELYFNFNANAFNGTVGFIPSSNAEAMLNMRRTHAIVNSLTPSDAQFGKKFIIRTYKGVVSSNDRISLLYEFTPAMQQIIVQNNMEYFRRNLLHSSIELFDKDEKEEEGLYHQSTYPIKTTNYSIGSYLKITKTPGIIEYNTMFWAIYKDEMVYQLSNGNSDSSDNIGTIMLHWVSKQSFEDAYILNCVFV